MGGRRGTANLLQHIIPPFRHSYFLALSLVAAVPALSPSDVPDATDGIQLAGAVFLFRRHPTKFIYFLCSGYFLFLCFDVHVYIDCSAFTVLIRRCICKVIH